MEIKSVRDTLAEIGLKPLPLNLLKPNAENFSASLLQPRGVIIADQDGVRSDDASDARVQFGAFLEHIAESSPDLAATPEYSMPWEMLFSALHSGAIPKVGGIWTFGCESIRYSELNHYKNDKKELVEIVFEKLEADDARFLCPLAHIFWSSPFGQGQRRLTMLCQFKTHPLSDPSHFERNGMQNGKTAYKFGGYDEQELRFLAIICSDAFNFTEDNAAKHYDRSLILHIQLNPQPKHMDFRGYRDNLFKYGNNTTDLICLNWAQNTKLSCGNKELFRIASPSSAWYTKSLQVSTDEVWLNNNHQRGFYYTNWASRRTHVLFFNFHEAVFEFISTKIDHIGVIGPFTKRVGPKVDKCYCWENGVVNSWKEVQSMPDAFEQLIPELGGAATSIAGLASERPFSAERVLALSTGNIDATEEWYKAENLRSCTIDSTESVLRYTYCQDESQKSRGVRKAAMIRCKNLWKIINDGDIPTPIEDLKNGFEMRWDNSSPHQNISCEGGLATVIYLGEDADKSDAEPIKKQISEYLRLTIKDEEGRRLARQRLAVLYRDENLNVIAFEDDSHLSIDENDAESEFYIGRA